MAANFRGQSRHEGRRTRQSKADKVPTPSEMVAVKMTPQERRKGKRDRGEEGDVRESGKGWMPIRRGGARRKGLSRCVEMMS